MDPIIADYENNGFYMAYYEAAINAFMKGDYKKAAEYLKPCFDGEYLNYKTANFYALLCKLNQDEETYETVLQVLANNGAELSPTVEQFLSKKIKSFTDSASGCKCFLNGFDMTLKSYHFLIHAYSVGVNANLGKNT